MRQFKISNADKCKMFLPIVCILFGSIGCKKLVEVDAPITLTNAETVYSDDTKSIAVLTGIYNRLSAGSLTSGDLYSISFFTGLSSDELALFNAPNQVD